MIEDMEEAAEEVLKTTEKVATETKENKYGFAFDVRGKQRCARMISFSLVEELVKSPVKIEKVRKGNSKTSSFSN